MNSFAELCQGYPEFRVYCHRLWENFSPKYALAGLEARAWPRLVGLGLQALEVELKEWQRRGLLPEPDPGDTEAAAYLWQSPVFQALMDCIGFYPPEDLDVRQYLPAPYQRLEEFVLARWDWHGRCRRGGLARGRDSYWQMALRLQAPLLYLAPFLPLRGPEEVYEGCDLACGWGRIALALPDYSRVRLQACDLAAQSLATLERLARLRQCDQAIQVHRVDVTKLPFASESFDFFLAFDIFEHLQDEALHKALSQSLRCARPGAVLYAEIPLHNYCPALTHVQGWGQPEVQHKFEAVQWEGWHWKLVFWNELVPEHFTFQKMASGTLP